MAIEIEDYAPEVAENPYTDDVKALSEAGEGKIGKIAVTHSGKVGKSGLDSAVAQAKIKISRAANELGFTARHRMQEPQGDGTTVLAFTLGERHKARRSKGDTADTVVVEEKPKGK